MTSPGTGSVRGGGILAGGIVGLEQAAGELFDLQRPPGWDALPLVNRLRLDAQGFGQRGFAAEVLNHLVDVVGIHDGIVSILTYYVNRLTVTGVIAICKIPFMSNIGQRIKQARLARKPRDVAVATGRCGWRVAPGGDAMGKTGETRALEGGNLVRVARALEVTTDWLLYGTGSGPGEPRSTRTVKVAVNDQVVEVDEESLRLVLAMQALSPQQRAAMHALVDSFTQPKAGGLKMAESKAGGLKMAE